MTQRSIAGLVNRAAATHGGKRAITCGGTSLTFGELRDEASALAAELADRGVAPGDRVGVSMRPSIEQIVALLGTILADAVAVPILPRLTDAGIAHVVEDAQLVLLFADPPRAASLESACPRATVLCGLRTRRPPGPGPASTAAGGDVAALLYSSGSTGPPKGIIVTHDNIVRGAEIVAGYLGTSHEDRIAGLLSLNFDYGLNQLWQSLLTGASLHLHELVLPRSALQMLASERITALPLMPALVQRLFGSARGGPPAEIDLSSVRYVTSTGGPISSWALSCLRGAFPGAAIYLMYGLTEAFRSSFLRPALVDERPTSVGKAIPGVELYVLDDDGRECEPGELGTLVHRGGCVARGYWNDAEATARTFRRLERFPGETVVWSHDLAWKDDGGYIHIAGRSDFLIKRDGYRIGPGEIESVANDHGAVAESVAVGVPDGDRGQRIVLAWTSRNGSGLDDAGLRTWLSERLPDHMVPSEVVRFDAFPVTAGEGKFDRAAVGGRIARDA